MKIYKLTILRGDEEEGMSEFVYYYGKKMEAMAAIGMIDEDDDCDGDLVQLTIDEKLVTAKHLVASALNHHAEEVGGGPFSRLITAEEKILSWNGEKMKYSS